jgi:hypothetical protein
MTRRKQPDPDGMKAVQAARQKTQTDSLRREARQTFGIVDKVEPVPEAGFDPQAERKEAERLAARHDPARPSACRLCAVTVPPTDRDVDGWKCCPDCQPLIRQGLSAVWSEVLGVDVARHEVEPLAARLGFGNPSRWLVGWPREPGNGQRWEHVPMDVVTNGRAALDAIRTVAVPRRNSTGRGCCWCGVRTSLRWTTSPFREARGRDGARLAACATCEPLIARSGARSGNGGDWRPYLLAAATGMRRAQWGVDYGLKAYFEAPGDHAGTEEPWSYLAGTRAELRLRIATVYPRLIRLTEHERRIADLRRTVADAARAPERLTLADL